MRGPQTRPRAHRPDLAATVSGWGPWASFLVIIKGKQANQRNPEKQQDDPETWPPGDLATWVLCAQANLPSGSSVCAFLLSSSAGTQQFILYFFPFFRIDYFIYLFVVVCIVFKNSVSFCTCSVEVLLR